jgi:7,8-dihydropterin-6-yl-methyl-4-(beta-D-ribofuranosyl)aminobenzene 5'-phosphate synthase
VNNHIQLRSVDRVSLTVLVENKADLIVESSDTVEYFRDEPLLAEHGFSVLIRLGSEERTILWDAGVTSIAMMENIRRMGIDVSSIEAIAISHGHRDHYAAITALLMEMNRLPEPKEWGSTIKADEIEAWWDEYRIPIIVHPAALRERWVVNDDGNWVGPFFPPPEQVWRALGAAIVVSEEPYQLDDGCWTTGYVPRTSFEEVRRPKTLHYRVGSEFIPDDLDEDQAILIEIKDKGLIVLSGCAHAGIVNTVEHARKISGTETILAVIGGFHLARANEDEIEQTIRFFKDINPNIIVPCHCTGLNAISRFAQEFPSQFIEGVVGATYSF